QDFPEPYRRHEISLNAAAFMSEGVVGRREQNQHEVSHHARKEPVGRNSVLERPRGRGGELHAEEENHQRWYDQRKEQERISFQVADFLPEDRSNLRWQKAERIAVVQSVAFILFRSAPGGRTLAQFLA